MLADMRLAVLRLPPGGAMTYAGPASSVGLGTPSSVVP